MFDLLVLTRSMQLFAHSAHFFVARSIFFQDHAFFSEVYQDAEKYFDMITERMIGLGIEKDLDLQNVLSKVQSKLKTAPSVTSKENKDFFTYLMSQVDEGLGLIEKYFDMITERMIGLGIEKDLDLQNVLSKVQSKLKTAPSVTSKENKDFFTYLMSQVDEGLGLIETICKDKDCSQGTMDMVAGIGSDFEVLKYKISRRLKA